MTRLECQVENCASNAQGCCCRPDIQVDGSSASDCGETCCASFQDKTDAYSNVLRHDVPNTSLEIGCNAANCFYNVTGRCGAENICVQGYGAGDKSQTECATFRCT